MAETTKVPSLSVFFPCYNEEKNVPHFVEEAMLALPKVSKKFEIIIVNDGSSDKTEIVAKKMVKKNPEVRLINHKKNKGYGAALKSGFRAAKYDWVFFTDGDLQFDLAQISTFIPYTKKYDVVIGYRKKRAEGSIRAFNARLFKVYVDILFRVHVKDIDCAFKLFKSDVIKSLDLVSDGAFTSAEFLYRMKKEDIAIKQVPVDHQLRKFGDPTGNNIKVIIKAGLEALLLYFTLKFGKK